MGDDRIMKSFTTQVQLIVYLSLICGHLVAAQQQAAQRWQQAASSDQLDSAGERVDKLTGAAGDLLWRPSAEQLEWFAQQQQQQYRRPTPSGTQILSNGYLLQAPSQSSLVGLDGPQSNYHALIDEFKQYSRLANPSRESRAFKPKLMSTARGFGKRAYLASPRSITYADLLSAANPNGAISTNGKMSGEAASSKYDEWIGQVLSRWPAMFKYVDDKHVDYNGNV